MRLVLFDIDGTLFPNPSTEIRFFKHLWRQRRLGLRQLSAAAWFPLRYWPRHGRQVMQKNKGYLAGLSPAQVAAWADEFVAGQLQPLVFAPTRGRLEAHQEAGDRVALLSGTPQFMADAIGRFLGVDLCLGTLCSLQSGHFTSAPPTRHPYGPAKIDAACQLAEQTGLALAEAVAYGDSINDSWLFEQVSQAVAVMPDQRLQALAEQRGWAVISAPDCGSDQALP